MNIIKTVLNDCKIHFHEVPSTLPTTSLNSTLKSNVQGVQVKFPSVSLEAHYTYQHDFVSMKLTFDENVNFMYAHALANNIAERFKVLVPPEVHVLTKQGNKIPQHIDIYIRPQNNYEIATLFMYLMQFPTSLEECIL